MVSKPSSSSIYIPLIKKSALTSLSLRASAISIVLPYGASSKVKSTNFSSLSSFPSIGSTENVSGLILYWYVTSSASFSSSFVSSVSASLSASLSFVFSSVTCSVVSSFVSFSLSSGACVSFLQPPSNNVDNNKLEKFYFSLFHPIFLFFYRSFAIYKLIVT